MNYNDFGNDMTKNEYFDSEMCSKRSNTMIIVGWLCVGVVTLLSIFSIFGAIQLIKFLSTLDFSQDIASIIGEIEKYAGMSLDVDAETLKEFEMSEIPVGEIFKWTFYITAAWIVIFVVAVIILSAIAMYKKSFGFAIAALVGTFASSLGIIAVVCMVAMLVILLNLDKEYKNYIQGNIGDPDNPQSGEPDFS